MQQVTLDAIKAHALEAYPNECVGFVVLVGEEELYLRGQNAGDKPAQMFLTRPEDYAAAEDMGKVVAFVHSHPDEAARPSPADLVACEDANRVIPGLTWIIVSVMPDGNGGKAVAGIHQFGPSGYKAPLLGRPFYHGVLDCYAIVRDWYAREAGIEIPDFERHDGWWEGEDELYLRNFDAAGFRPLAAGEQLVPGDVILMQIRSKRTNHAAVFIGDRALSEAPNLHRTPDAMLHHLYGRLSERAVYGGQFAKATRMILRHKGN